MVHGPDHPQAGLLLDVVDAQALFDRADAVPHIQAAGLVGVRLLADGLFDFVGDVLDVAIRLVMDGGIHGPAVGVAQHHDQAAAQVPGHILDAAQLVVVDDVACQPDDEQLPDACREDVLRDDPRIRAGDDNGIGRLALRPGGQPNAAGDIAASILRIQVFQVPCGQFVDGIRRSTNSGFLPKQPPFLIPVPKKPPGLPFRENAGRLSCN